MIKTNGFEPLLQWIKNNAVPIHSTEPGSGCEDLRPLKDIIGDARLVCLGESRHDAREHHQLKHRIIEFLVDEMDFGAFAMEEGFPYCRRLDDYIRGADSDPETLLNGMNIIWDTEEVLALIRWMRAHNEYLNDDRKLRFYGFDIINPRPAVEDVIAYLRRVEPAYAESTQPDALGLKLFGDVISETVERYSHLSGQEKTALSSNLSRLVTHLKTQRSRYVLEAPERDFEWTLREALSVQAADTSFNAWAEKDYEGCIALRDQAMADNTRWIMDNEVPGKRVIIWAHNFHLARTEVGADFTPIPVGPKPVMGSHLSRAFGEDMVSIGFSYNSGVFADTTTGPADEDTVDGLLARAGMPLYMVDLRKSITSPGREWLTQKRKMRAERGHMEPITGSTFDVLIFADEIGSTTPSRLARKCRKELGWK